jgi:Tol biopolymer transport system component
VLASEVGLLNAVKPAEATFPGFNGKIAFSSGQKIYTINPDGTGRFQVTKGIQDEGAGTVDAFSPSFSPNGNRIVYFGDSDFSGEAIYSVNAGGGPETIIPAAGYEDQGIYTFSPSYTPSGLK